MTSNEDGSKIQLSCDINLTGLEFFGKFNKVFWLCSQRLEL